MSRCFACCQENCGHGPCSCICHLDDAHPPSRPKPPEDTRARAFRPCRYNLKCRLCRRPTVAEYLIGHSMKLGSGWRPPEAWVLVCQTCGTSTTHDDLWAR